jgi:hypothetical protein
MPPENELDLDKLFLPAWAQEPASANLYAEYQGEARGPREDRRGPRRGPGPGGERGPRRDRPQGQGFGGREGKGQAPGDSRRGREGGRGPDRRGGPEGRREGHGPGPRGPGRDRREHRPAPAPLPEIAVSLISDEKGVDSLAKQIRMTGRAYPLFEIAWMILQRPERLSAVFSVKKNGEGKVIQPLFVCVLDDTLWLSEDEAVAHILQKHFNTFYQAERTATEPPKGKYTFVAQCGMSGVVLGPPNYHDYQNQLRKLHAERFARLPFEAYKARVKIVRDEEVVKKWIEEQSWKTEYVCLNMPEPVKLPNMEAVEKHFRETHKENIIKQVEMHTLSGTAARNIRSPELARLARTVWEDQRRFPLQIATALSQQFAGRGLQFFKVNRTVTHVSVARPHYLDMEATPVSEGVKGIVDFINAHPKSTRRQLLDALAPAPPQPTPVQTAIIADLHWLVHQGHVIEFANGVLETAKKPVLRPPKPEPKSPRAAGAASEQATAATTAPEPETTAASEGVAVETPAAETEPVAGTGVEEGAAHQPESTETPQNEAPKTAEHDKQTPAEAAQAPEIPADKPVESPS